jgi:hypothetical protein
MFIFAKADKTGRDEALPPPSKGAEAMAELTVLLPEYQAHALEEAAHNDGLTTGQFLRRLINEALR